MSFQQPTSPENPLPQNPPVVCPNAVRLSKPQSAATVAELAAIVSHTQSSFDARCVLFVRCWLLFQLIFVCRLSFAADRADELQRLLSTACSQLCSVLSSDVDVVELSEPVATDGDVLAVVIECCRLVRNLCVECPFAQGALGSSPSIFSAIALLLSSTHLLAEGGDSWTRNVALAKSIALQAVVNLCAGHPGNQSLAWSLLWTTPFSTTLHVGLTSSDRKLLARALSAIHVCVATADDDPGAGERLSALVR